MCSTRARLMILLAAGLLVSVALPAGAAPGDIIKLGPGGDPQWSPDGKLIALICDGYLQVTPADGKGPRTKLAEYRGQSYVWASDTEIVWSERPDRRSDTTLFKSVMLRRMSDSAAKAESIVSASGPELVMQAADDFAKLERIFGPIRLVDGTVGYLRTRGSLDGPARFAQMRKGTAPSLREKIWPRAFVKTAGEYLPPVWGDLWLGTAFDSSDNGRQLTYGRRLGMVQVSPARDRIIARSLSPNGWIIIDTLGRECNSLFEPLRRTQPEGYIESASNMQWSPDGAHLCFLRTQDDGHVIRDSRLVISDVSQKNVTEILGHEGDDIGSFSWSPRGAAIVVATQSAGVIVVEVEP